MTDAVEIVARHLANQHIIGGPIRPWDTHHAKRIVGLLRDAGLLMEWRTDFDAIPLDQPVFIILTSRGKPALYIGAKIDGGDGWLWHMHAFPSFGFHMVEDHLNDWECDDDYAPVCWMPMLPIPPEQKRNAR